MSIGYLIDEDLAVVWRGPMLLRPWTSSWRDVSWGELDYLLVDLPPGTGDIQLSLAQKVPVAGAMPFQPPKRRFDDVKRAIDMWSGSASRFLASSKIWLHSCARGDRIYPASFKGSLDKYLRQPVSKLGEVPFHPQVGLSSEAESDRRKRSTCPESRAFCMIAETSWG